MDRETSDAVTKGLAFLWTVGIAALGGLVSYLQKLSGDNPEKWSWIVAASKVLTAGFVGLLTDWLLSGWNLPRHFIDFALGVAGYGGSETIAFFQSIFRETVKRAAGVKEDEPR